MIKVELKRWALTVLRKQTWFGYTYIMFSQGKSRFGRWYKNSHSLVKSFKALNTNCDIEC